MPHLSLNILSVKYIYLKILRVFEFKRRFKVKGKEIGM